MYNISGKAAEKGGIGTATSILNTGLYVGACIATPMVGWFIKVGGGFSAAGGYLTAVYMFSICMVVAFVCMLLFTREVNGRFIDKDFAIVSKKSCNLE